MVNWVANELDPDCASVSETHYVKVVRRTDPTHTRRGDPLFIAHVKLAARLDFHINALSEDRFKLIVDEITYIGLAKVSNLLVDEALEEIRAALVVLGVNNIEVPDRPIAASSER